MNTKNLLLSGLAGGLTTVVLTNVPFISLLTFVCCVSFWIGPLLAVWLYRRLEGQVTLNQGLAIGAVAGGIAGLIGFILSFFNLAGVGDVAEALQVMPGMTPQDLQQMQALFSGPMLILFNLVGVAFTIFFGVIGGLAGGAAFKSKKTVTPDFMPPGTPSSRRRRSRRISCRRERREGGGQRGTMAGAPVSRPVGDAGRLKPAAGTGNPLKRVREIEAVIVCQVQCTGERTQFASALHLIKCSRGEGDERTTD